VLASAVAILAMALAAGISFLPPRARGDEAAAEEPLGPTPAQTMALLESGRAGALVEEPETDLHAAQTMPHLELERGEALRLAEAVFEPEIESPGGIYDELEPEKYLSDHAAVVPISSLPEEAGGSDEGLAVEHPNTPVLVESLLPLRTENASGAEEGVDLELQHSQGELQPANPLAEVGIPEHLGEGISLGEPDVEISIAGAPGERVATDADGKFAFYPEVALDTDLIVAPTPRGVETMTDIRSAEAPASTTYQLSLPPGSELRATEEGGAEVVEGGRTALAIPAPTAIDAAGNPVQTEMSVSGESITVAVVPTPSTAYPLLVDPTYIGEGWRWTLNRESLAAWSGYTNNPVAMLPVPYEVWQPPNQYPGLDLTSGYGGVAYWGNNADWEYWVPRYREDLGRFHTAPSSWVYQMSTEGVLFLPYGNTENYPALVMGLVNPENGWQVSSVHYGGQGEMNNWSNTFTYTNEYEQHTDKGADMNLVTYQEERPAKRRDTYMADAYIAVADYDAPRILELNPPSGWTNGPSAAIPYTFEDAGLGVRSAGVRLPGETAFRWAADFSCTGTTASPCPREPHSGEAGRPKLLFDPNELPTGVDELEVMIGDPFWTAGHVASSMVFVEVDHTTPEVSLSGSLTEQGSLGTHRPRYALRVNAKDGVEGAPQSGIKKVEIRVDGKPVPLPEPAEWEPNCQTQNCPFNGEWTMNASEYGSGSHEVQVIATDAAGNASPPKVLQVELHQPPPTLALSGTMTEQVTLGTERPSYKLQINASALAESPTPAAIPTYSSSFGTSGTGNGQFTRPGSMAIDAQGNLWVADANDNRIEEFSAQGVYLRQFGTKGPGNGQLNHPTAIAVAANGNLWVTDSFNQRVEEFTPAGAYVAKFGSPGPGNGQFAGTGPEALAIDYHGNIWVADTGGGRLEKFNEAGTFIRSVATHGKGPGQLGQPVGIAIAPGGNVFVADWEDDKVAEYGEGGGFIRQFGSEGSEPGQLQNPTGIAIDSRGDIWVPDQNNGRVEEFNQGGEYLGRFGVKGTGAGQFELSYPTGIATDTRGDIWVTDAGDNRVEKWVSANYGSTLAPTYLGSFGSPGTTPGHFSDVLGLAVDAKGNVWTADANNNLLQKFNAKGEFLAAYGKAGTGNGELSAPTALTANSGHIWDAEMFNARAQEFNESGGYLAKFGQGGGAAGQLEYPWGMAIDAGHHVWVTETGPNAVQEFTESGTFIRQLGKKGSGNGEFNGATGIAVGPGGRLWVVDIGNNRVEEFTESGTFLRQFGGKGSEVGHLVSPMGIYVDPNEHVWVVDRGNDRVVEFNGQGEYIGQFGSGGSGPGQFTTPQYVVGDQSGHMFVTDSGLAKVEEWSAPSPNSQISTEIAVDGKRVEAAETGCATETCSSTKEWTLQSSSLTPGSHAVVVRATDGLGNTTSKTLNIKVGDATKPSLEVGGELVDAPEGWIEQAEGNYGLHATATDTGYGVTSLVFSLDGKAVASKTQSCPAGACSATISTTVNAHELAAGAHPAEVVATDGAGNVVAKTWQVNVDPDGAVTTEELAATAEALEETSGSPILSSTDEIPGIAASTSGAGLTENPEAPGNLQATGTQVPMEIGKTPEEGFEIYPDGLSDLSVACDEVEEPAEEECVPRVDLEAAAAKEEEEVAAGLKHPGTIPITVTPVATPGSAGEVALINGQSAVSANAAGEEADTFTRPLTDGGLSFADIRGPAAPENYAYEMSLSPKLHLRQPDPQHIEVFYWEYGVTAFVITGEPAFDAIGTTVPTHLSISGPAKFTLTVEYRGQSPAGGGFVYPVMGGTGWQGGYRTVSFEMNEPRPEPEESQEEGGTGEEGEETIIGPPEPSTPQAAGVTNLAMLRTAANNTTRHRIRWIRCQHRWEPAPWSPRVGTEHPCGNPFTREEAYEEFAFNFGIASYVYVSPGNFVRHRPGAETDVECAKELFPSHWNGVLLEVAWFINPAEQCQWWPVSNGNGGEEVGPGHHLCLYGEWNAGEGNTGHWTTFQVGSAIWIESTHGGEGYEVSRRKTTLHKCN
jgi:sugar lactone lactonase YvrE